MSIIVIDSNKPQATDAEIQKSIIIKRGAHIPLNQVELDYLAKEREENKVDNDIYSKK